MFPPKFKQTSSSNQRTWRLTQASVLTLPLLPTFSAIGFVLVMIWTWKQQFQQISQRPMVWGFVILSLGLILSSAFAYNSTDAFLGLANFIPFFALFASLSILIKNVNQLRSLAWLLILSSLPITILGLGQLFWQWQTAEILQTFLGWELVSGGNPLGRMSAVFMYTNLLAAYLIIVLILTLGLLIETYKTWRTNQPYSLLLLLSLIILLSLQGTGIVLTSSRNAWGIAGLALLIFALYLGWYIILGGVTAIITSILWAAYGLSPGRDWLREIIPVYFWGRLTDQFYPDREIATLRTTQWQFAGEMTLDRPWLGWGLSNFSALYQEAYEVWVGHPHNIFLMLTAEIGIPLTILLSSLIAIAIARSLILLYSWYQKASHLNYREQTDRFILFSFILAFSSCILFNCLDITLFDLRINLITWVLFAAIVGVTNHYQR